MLSMPWGVSADMIGSDPLNWDGWIRGPRGTPYEDGIFKLHLRFTSDYPFEVPRVRFVTKIYHPNVDNTDGSICVTAFNSKWTADMTVLAMLAAVQQLLAFPNHASSHTGSGWEAAKLYRSDPAAFERKAREMTRDFAKA
jgi:ubiquitin-protein ligase